jgi:hypothetical protein
MARQCPRGHDGIKPGEVADDTSMKHPAHQAQISPHTRHNSLRASSRSPWPKSRASETKGMQASVGNRVDLADRQNRHRLIYRLSTISAAETGGARQNRARWRRGDAVARGVTREVETRVSEGER